MLSLPACGIPYCAMECPVLMLLMLSSRPTTGGIIRQQQHLRGEWMLGRRALIKRQDTSTVPRKDYKWMVITSGCTPQVTCSTLQCVTSNSAPNRCDSEELDGHAAVAAVRPVLEECLNRSHGAFSFRLTKVLTGHGFFGKYLCRIDRDQTSQCHHCGDGRNDTALHTLAECPAWAEQRRDLVAAIGDVGNLSLSTVVCAMVGSESGWCAVATFCEAVMLAKKVAEREREAAFYLPSCRRRIGRRRVAEFRPP
nr:uncharacterized protein LOC116765719 [Danaus plexippus plexippus]